MVYQDNCIIEYDELDIDEIDKKTMDLLQNCWIPSIGYYFTARRFLLIYLILKK